MTTEAVPELGPKRLRHKAYGAFRGEFHVPDLEAWPRRRPPSGGHRGGACAAGAVRLRESGGRLARGTGMMTDRGGSTIAGGPTRHGSVLRRSARELLNVRDGGVYIDRTFGSR